MAKIKRKTVGQVSKEARLARLYASANQSGYVAEQTAINLSRGPAKGIDRIPVIGGRFPKKSERKAAVMLQKTRATEMTRSEARAKGVTNRAAKKAAADKLKKAVTGPSRKATKRATDLAKKSKKK
jgi:hypothetical protein